MVAPIIGIALSISNNNKNTTTTTTTDEEVRSTGGIVTSMYDEYIIVLVMSYLFGSIGIV